MRTALVGVTLLGLLALVAAGSAGGEWGGGPEELDVRAPSSTMRSRSGC